MALQGTRGGIRPKQRPPEIDGVLFKGIRRHRFVRSTAKIKIPPGHSPQKTNIIQALICGPPRHCAWHGGHHYPGELSQGRGGVVALFTFLASEITVLPAAAIAVTALTVGVIGLDRICRNARSRQSSGHRQSAQHS
jgi:hypothetical protein